MKTTHQVKECIFVVVFPKKKKIEVGVEGGLTERGNQGKENRVWGKLRPTVVLTLSCLFDFSNRTSDR